MKAFTLIELMIVVSLMAILGLIGTASFLSYERSDRLKGAANSLKSEIRLAQNKALSGSKETAASTCILVGWFINIETADAKLQTRGVCKASGVEGTFGTKNNKVGRDVTITNIVYQGNSYNGVNVLFRPLENRAYFFQTTAPPFLNPTTDAIDTTKLLGTDNMTDQLMIFLQSSSKLYMVEIYPNGKINEKKI